MTIFIFFIVDNWLDVFILITLIRPFRALKFVLIIYIYDIANNAFSTLTNLSLY